MPYIMVKGEAVTLKNLTISAVLEGSIVLYIAAGVATGALRCSELVAKNGRNSSTELQPATNVPWWLTAT